MSQKYLRLAAIPFIASVFSSAGFADSLLVGFNGQTPLQAYSSSGLYQQDFGPTGASAGIEEGGLLYVVQPNMNTLSSSTITAYNAAQQSVSSFTVPFLIGDGAPGTNGTLWLSGYNGTVYQVSSSGSVVDSFNTGYTSATSIGVASNGNYLFTTEGDTGDGIDERSFTGAVISTVHTGLYSLYGLAWDSTNSEFFAGSFNTVYGMDLNFANSSAQVTSTWSIVDNNRAPNGAIHDGLEYVDLSALKQPTHATVPEPGFGGLTAVILLLGAAMAGLRGRLKRVLAIAPIFAVAIVGAGSASAAVIVSLNAGASSVPLGEVLQFSASGSDTSNSGAAFTYQFNVRPTGTAAFTVVKDFYKYNTFAWAPMGHEGSYDVQVVARSSSGATGAAIETISVTSRVQGGVPAVNATSNPLVALYSAPPCSSPKQVRVRFHAQGETVWQLTPMQTCNGMSVNFYIAGMRAATKYTLQQDTFNGPFDTPGPQLTFTTGTVPGNINTGNPTVLQSAEAPTSTSYPFELRCWSPAYATDLEERVVWFLPENLGSGYVARFVPGGTFLGIADDQRNDHKFFREYDLAGNVVRETNWSILNQEIDSWRSAHGLTPSNVRLSYFSHEGYRMPNGDTLTIVSEERVGNQGQGTVDILGDIIVVLDPNFQLKWAWDAFDFLPITRKALNNDTCTPGQGGCPGTLFNTQPNGQVYTIANDWTHANSVAPTTDGNLVISLRHQAWAIKVAYANGTGNGRVIWTLGNGGNFALASGYSPSEWFNYQHDVEFQSNGLLSLFDNNNLETPADSRGQAWSLNESSMIATPVVNDDLGVASYALGSAQLLSNGNYWFGAGFAHSATSTYSTEFTPSGAVAFHDFSNGVNYRTFRLINMYRLQ